MPDNNSIRYADHHLLEKSSKIVSSGAPSPFVMQSSADHRFLMSVYATTGGSPLPPKERGDDARSMLLTRYEPELVDWMQAWEVNSKCEVAYIFV
jgi:hypothetical protein